MSTPNMTGLIANRVHSIHPSSIRSVQKKILAKKNVISFAAGLPAADLFPIEDFQRATNKVFENSGQEAMQYGMTQGYMPLIRSLIERMKLKQQIETNPSEIIISTGSQQGLFLSAMTLVNEGDTVIAENPSYLGAFNAFRGFGAKFCGINTDDEGIDLQQLAENLENNKTIKLIYVIPNYQNPTGKSWSQNRREEFIALVSKYPVYVIEDDPYGELCFDNQPQMPLKSLDKTGQVIYLGSFSKILCPGLRVAWICSNSEITEKMELLKQGIDLQSSEFTQHQVHSYLSEVDIDDHINAVNAVYGRKCQLLLEQLETINVEGLKFTKPTGGIFVWLALPDYMDSSQLIDAAIEKGVAYIPGQSFFIDENITNTIRLNFSTVSEEEIVKGVAILKGFLEGVASQKY